MDNELFSTCFSPCTVRFRNAPDGNLLSDGYFAYTWDADNRLVSTMPLIPANGSKRVRNAYDWRSRRAEKSVDAWDATTESWIPSETRRYVYDDWNPILETVVTYHSGTITSADGSGASIAATTNRIAYLWGPDLSETLQGAGGVGGLLAVSVDGAYCFPCCDANGNVTAYVAEDGTLVASYVYDAFGNAVSSIGPLSGAFTHRFSTKPYDPETGLYYYGYRYYSPILGRFLNRDPIEESGGANLYAFCANDPVSNIDLLGMKSFGVLWRDPTEKEWAVITRVAHEISRRCEDYISAIDKFIQNHFPQRVPVPYGGIAQPREFERTANLSSLPNSLIVDFMLQEHKENGTLAWALSNIRARLEREKEIGTYKSIYVSTCSNLPCQSGLFAAFSLPWGIGLCKKQFGPDDMSRKNILAHEAAHKFHSAIDFYYWPNPAKRIEDAYAWGSVLSD